MKSEIKTTNSELGFGATSAPVAICIIVPHLNQERALARCLKALSQQASSIGQTEIIVVDNGSRALPTALCAEFPGVRLLTEKTPGPGPARNRGIAGTNAQVLAFIDADCRPHPEWLKVVQEEMLGKGPGRIIGGDVRIDVADPQNLTALEAYESVFAYRQRFYIEKRGFSGTGNLAMTRGAYLDVGPFGGIDVAEDREWGQRATKKGFAIQYIKEMIVYHPARHTFSELQRKWDRHVSHDFEQKSPGMMGHLKWSFLILAVAASGVVDIWRILVSDRILTVRQRFLACGVLVRIRLYRAWAMLMNWFEAGSKLSHKWNRN